MKQLVIISGKGGTGKTTITAAIASMAENAIIADCDVDAPNLHLVLEPEITEASDFHGMEIAHIDTERCTGCNICIENCNFDAIYTDHSINSCKCEGCGVCEYVCPENAIKMINNPSGSVFDSMTRYGPMVHAELMIGEEASGKLVTAVKEHASSLAGENGAELIICDGPPGTGCPVIAAITGADLALIVTEPSLSGIHDLERIIQVTDHFRIPAIVCINKYSINEENTKQIEISCKENGIIVAGKLPYDTIPNKAMIGKKTVIEYADNEFSENLREIWKTVRSELCESP
ncbi:MinD superfamily P-loop ATPase, contains an inserted ferredoxin domain [Methanococcoides vulcani]|uniref:MinD superfamily P-loop ATPase, contains an inserted ferredoxin domain n=1 Tax=Methanococcoides vulcani TaxID=1353158 RepID=A0A1H9Z9N9_9EURY|nr:ATP-binding protein [Methanococcoides vulcani]SES78057.1 MinD superfamily P-loop ATPase, contains an inserted ferredoxin domain [Methanococcoides vulcani]